MRKQLVEIVFQKRDLGDWMPPPTLPPRECDGAIFGSHWDRSCGHAITPCVERISVKDGFGYQESGYLPGTMRSGQVFCGERGNR